MGALDTPFAQHLRGVYNLPLPSRFYDRNFRPIVTPDAPLMSLFEKKEDYLSVDDIIAAYVLSHENLSSVDIIKNFAAELSTRFGIETKYTNYSSAQLEADRSYWRSTFRALKVYEKLLSDTITSINSRVNEYEQAELSRPEVQQSNLVFTNVSWNLDKVSLDKIRDRDLELQPIINGTRLTNEDGPDIFALFPVSGEEHGIPYLGYHTPQRNRYRVSSNPPHDEEIHPDREEYNYDIISQSDLYSDLRGSTAFLSFMFRGIFGILDLSHSALILNRVHRDEESATTSGILRLLDFLIIEGLTHRRITARVVSPVGGPINYNVLYFDCMYNQAEYIGFKEEEEPQLLKPTKLLYLLPIPIVINPVTDEYAWAGEIEIIMANRVASNSELLTLNKSGKTYELHRGTSYVEFIMRGITDDNILSFSVEYMSRLVGHYHNVAKPEYGPFIAQDFGIKSELELSSDSFHVKSTSDIRGIDLISHTYPEVFGHNYTRQCPHYPVVKERLEPGDVEFNPEVDQSARDRWLRFPPDGSTEFYFRCGVDEPDHAQPGIIISKLKNREKYPLLPCCFKGNEFLPGKRTEIAYRLGSARASSISAVDITESGWGPLNYPPVLNRRLLMAADKVVYRGRLGKLPEALTSIISSDILSSESSVVRLGLSEPNFIHAAFLAADREYQKLSTATPEIRMNYIKSHLVFPHESCLYQELEPQDCGKEILLENLMSWTYDRHYRILEESLGINLYVLVRHPPRENQIEPNHYYFELPVTRSGAPHMRRHDSRRPSVLLYKVRRQDAQNFVDLILHDTPYTALWDQSSTKKIGELYTRSAEVLTFGSSPIKRDSYGAYINFNTGDYVKEINAKPVAQLIDERGLCRAVTFQEKPKDESYKFTIVFPGTQPYNLPFSKSVRKTTYKASRKLFSDACLLSSVRDGVFYLTKDDPSRYIFVPLVSNDASIPPDLPTTDYTPLTGLSHDQVDFTTQWRTAYVYLRVLLFMITFLYAFSETRDPLEFMRKYIFLDTSRHSARASEIYDFSNLKRTIVLQNLTMEEAFGTLRRLCPTLLNKQGNKLVLTSQRIYDGIKYFVRSIRDQTEASVDLKKKRWDLSRVIAPPREGGIPATLLLSRKTQVVNPLLTTLNFGSEKSMRIWFGGIRSGSASGSMVVATDLKAVVETIRSGTGVILWRHAITRRVWLIPGVTYNMEDCITVCYLWYIRHRVVELASHLATLSAVERISGRPVDRTAPPITAIFQPRTAIVARRSTKGKFQLGPVEEYMEVPYDLQVMKYGMTRDQKIELIGSFEEKPGKIIVEILHSAPNGYTPMLSP
jgi:hypothetical protein